MLVALIDNGSLEPAAHRNLRAVAAALSARTGVTVEAVSWKHSDRIPPAALDGVPAWTIAPWVRDRFAGGAREFLFVPFFISAQGAIGSALRFDLEKLSAEVGPISFAFTAGLAAQDVLTGIISARIRETIAARHLRVPAVVVVDHGGPSAASAALRDQIAAQVRIQLCMEISSLTAASMEGAHGPRLAEVLASPACASGDVVVAPLFLSPGRHAGPDGDLAQIARSSPVERTHIHLTELVGTHAAVIDALAAALRHALTSNPTAFSV